MTAAMTVRVAKLAMTASLAALAGIVALDNVLDYGTNFEFVRHVLSMDTVFPGNPLRYRAIQAPWLWRVGYGGIIAAEALTCALFAAGTVLLAWHLRSTDAQFAEAKRFATLGALLAFLIWFTGFMVVGGEWFGMWQSAAWNGQEGAFRFYMPALVYLVFLNQAE